VSSVDSEILKQEEAMRSSILGSILLLAVIVVVMPSCVDSDGDDLEDDEFDEGVMENELTSNGPLEGPTIHAIFALYGNLPEKEDDTKYREVDHLPGPLKKENTEARLAWGVVNTLGGKFDVWHVGPNEWWNIKDLKTPRWIYDDASLRHDTQRESGRIRELSDNHKKPGFIYMAYTGEFRGLGTIYRPKRATYFYEIYQGNQSEDAYHDWKQRASRNKVPMFNITVLSRDFNGNDDPKHCGFAYNPDWETTKAQIYDSVIVNPFYDGAYRIKIGFYSGCFINHEDAEPLANYLNYIQGLLIH